MKYFFLYLAALFAFSSLPAQTCHEIAVKKGQNAYDQANYAKALQYWEAGKECEGADVRKLNNLIWKAKDADGDGVVNGRDDCPDTYGAASNGCQPAVNLDRDEDGIPDSKDECPDNYGPQRYNGCPDKDFDETPDIKDACPDVVGPRNAGGCPDRDSDGVIDPKDECPDTPGTTALAGCPDRDSDGVIDPKDECPDTPGPKRFSGCPDKDYDEMPDYKDACPDIPGPKNASGCPDRDGDSVADKDDVCPDVPGMATVKGCPDHDGDGIADKDDACPDYKGVPEKKGCPGLVINYDMAQVEGGSFTMGSPANESGRSNDACQHDVGVGDFSIGRYEVTQAQWKAVMGDNPSGFKNCDDCPVECVSWNDIQEFIKKLNAATGKKYRLPTEAEWEYAAKGGNKSKGYKYAGSNDLDAVAWYGYEKSDRKTHPVGSKSPNELGLYDMSGNVWEWCQDTYKPYPCDKENKEDSSGRVLRGGSWGVSNVYCRSAARNGLNPTNRIVNYGFRLAQD